MFRKTLITLALVLSLGFSGNAFAGSGPPANYNDLAYVAQYIEGQIAYYESTGSLDYDITTHCVKWSNFVSWIEYYNMYETKFYASAVCTETTNTWAIKLAQSTGQNMNFIPKYKLNRLKAQQKIAKMDAWHAEFSTFYYGTAYGLRATYCSEEQLCVPSPEPQYSTVYVQNKDIGPYLFPCNHTHLFTFYLSMSSTDLTYDEDGLLEQVRLSVIMTGDHYDYLRNCTVTSENFTLSYIGSPSINTEYGTGEMVFNIQPNTYIAKGTTRAFDVFCDIVQPLEQYSYIQTGFIPNMGTGPNEGITVYGANTAQKLVIEPNTEITTVLTN